MVSHIDCSLLSAHDALKSAFKIESEKYEIILYCATKLHIQLIGEYSKFDVELQLIKFREKLDIMLPSQVIKLHIDNYHPTMFSEKIFHPKMKSIVISQLSIALKDNFIPREISVSLPNIITRDIGWIPSECNLIMSINIPSCDEYYELLFSTLDPRYINKGINPNSIYQKTITRMNNLHFLLCKREESYIYLSLYPSHDPNYEPCPSCVLHMI